MADDTRGAALRELADACRELLAWLPHHWPGCDLRQHPRDIHRHCTCYSEPRVDRATLPVRAADVALAAPHASTGSAADERAATVTFLRRCARTATTAAEHAREAGDKAMCRHEEGAEHAYVVAANCIARGGHLPPPKERA